MSKSSFVPPGAFRGRVLRNAVSKSYFTVRFPQWLSSLFSKGFVEGAVTTFWGRLFHKSTTLWLKELACGACFADVLKSLSELLLVLL